MKQGNKSYTSYNYKGFTIYHNRNSDNFDAEYISIVNLHKTLPDGKNPHCHVINSDQYAKKVVDCAIDISKMGFTHNKQRAIKNKALRLVTGMVVKYN